VTRPSYADTAYGDPRKTKKNQGIPNRKVWISLAETGLFNGL